MKLADRKYKTLVIEILSSSFDDNHSINYIIKQDVNRKKRMRYLMAYCFEVCLGKGQIFINDDETACVLILHPEKKISMRKKVILDLNLALKSIGITRIRKIVNRERLIKANQPKKPFYYLWFIGVDPKKQGKGLGTSLLTEALKKCDENKRPVYLETSVLRNLPWYEKFGFNIFYELDLGYKLYQMLRQ